MKQYFKDKIRPAIDKFAPLIEKFLLESGNSGLFLGDKVKEPASKTKIGTFFINISWADAMEWPHLEE